MATTATTTTSPPSSSRSAAAGPLSSDHVNYLIFRYLQESGFEDACTALWRDWHRPPEYREPERLPFASAVGRHELISVIQDGLFFDELQAQQRRGRRRFQFTGAQPIVIPRRIAGLASGDDDSVSGLEKGERGPSRPGSRGKRRGQKPGHSAGRLGDDFPTPAPKRQRRSEGHDASGINGEGMDLDAKTPASVDAEGSAEGGEGGEAFSPAVDEEPEAVEVAERYDSMDVATQTDDKSGPKVDTMYWPIGVPGATLDHASWAPSDENDDSAATKDKRQFKTLLLAGQNLCRTYEVPDFGATDAEPELINSHDPIMMLRPNSDSMVTAMTWHPNGKTTTFAVDSQRELPDGTTEPEQSIIDDTKGYGSVLYPLGPPLETSSSVVSKLLYNPSGTRLLVLKISVKGGLVQVYDTPSYKTDDNGEDSDELKDQPRNHQRDDPVAWCILERMPSDAVWTSDDSFSVCGQESLFRSFKTSIPSQHTANGLNTPDSYTAESIAVHGLEELQQESPFASQSADADADQQLHGFDKICHDPGNGLTLLLSPNTKTLAYLTVSSSASPDRQDGTLSLEAIPNDMSLRPLMSSSSATTPTSIVVLTFLDGSCRLYGYPSSSNPNSLEIKEIDTFHFSHSDGSSGPALSPCWTQDGKYLAISSNTHKIEIWKFENLASSASSSSRWKLKREKFVDWKPSARFYTSGASTASSPQEDTEEEKNVTEPRMAWSGDGKSLVFGVERQIAIIRFRSPLESSFVSTTAKEEAAVGDDGT